MRRVVQAVVFWAMKLLGLSIMPFLFSACTLFGSAPCRVPSDCEDNEISLSGTCNLIGAEQRDSGILDVAVVSGSLDVAPIDVFSADSALPVDDASERDAGVIILDVQSADVDTKDVGASDSGFNDVIIEDAANLDAGVGDVEGADVSTPPLPWPQDPYARCQAETADEGRTVVHLSPAQSSDIPTILSLAAPQTTFVFGPGDYSFTERILINVPQITLRSLDDDPQSVRFIADLSVDVAVDIAANDVTVSGIHFVGNNLRTTMIRVAGFVRDAHRARIRRCRFTDGAYRSVFASSNIDDLFSADQGVVECLVSDN